MSKAPRRPSHDPHWPPYLAPAPSDLRLIQALVNTTGPSRPDDLITKPRALREWLIHWDLLRFETRLTRKDVTRFKKLRAGLRMLIRANYEAAVDPKLIEELNEIAASAPLGMRITASGATQIVPAGTRVQEAIARLFMVLDAARHDGTWRRFKLCIDPKCRTAFFDISRPCTATWCSRSCRDKSKSRTYRKRRKRFRMARRLAMGLPARRSKRGFSDLRDADSY